MKFSKKEIYEHWSNGKDFDYLGTLYKIGKMSYAQYFLEPKKPVCGREWGIGWN